MRRLIEGGLFGAGLVLIDTASLVSIYNDCLSHLGIGPTVLQTFSIDGVGWSPEIAEEKNNNQYLCAGIANPMGVIVTPDQRNKPIYLPFSSYERGMLRAYFDRHHNSIADITSTNFIGLDIDQELTRYETPHDLTLVHYIVVRSLTGGLSEAGRCQKELIERFQGEGLVWFDSKFRGEIIENARIWGDLRHRRVDIPDFRFDIKSYHTRAFGGVFVLRCSREDKTILVVEDKKMLDGFGKNLCEAYWVYDPLLIDRLRRAGFVEINFGWYRKHPEVIVDKKDGILADILTSEFPDVSYQKLTNVKKRHWGIRLADKLPAVFHELERLTWQLSNGDRLKAESCSSELRAILLRPRHDLSESEQEVIWMFLCRLQFTDVFRLYYSDKNRFFTEYQLWPDSKKEWAIKIIREKYVPRMNQLNQ